MTEASRDDMRMTIGTLEGYAASVDLMLCQSLHVLLKCTPAAARAIFYTLDSFPARKTLLTRVAEAIGDEQDQEMIGKMLASAERANNQRREVAHGLLVVADLNEVGVKAHFIKPKSTSKKPVTEEWLKDMQGIALKALFDTLNQLKLLTAKHKMPFQIVLDT
jgi:hypothetical protein